MSPYPEADPETDAAADSGNYPALRDEFRATVGAWTVFGMVVLGFVMAALAMFRWSSALYELLVVLWANISVVIACVWMWRRQFVPVRVDGKVITGTRARRWAVGIALCSSAFTWVQISGPRYGPQIRDAAMAALATDPPRISERNR